MVTEDEEKRLRGRSGNRPGDVLRMYRLFTALKYDPNRVRAEQFLRSSMPKSPSAETEADAAEADAAEWSDEQDEYGKVPAMPNLDPFEKALQEQENQAHESDQEDDEDLHGTAVTAARGSSSTSGMGTVLTNAQAKREAALRQQAQDKEDRLVGLLKASVLRSQQTSLAPNTDAEENSADDDGRRGLDAAAEAAIQAEVQLGEQQALLLREKGAGLGRFADQWSRRDKREIPGQHRSREVQQSAEAQQEARLMKRVLAELHAEEAATVESADATAESWARRAQRDLVAEGMMHPEQVSTLTDMHREEDDAADAGAFLEKCGVALRDFHVWLTQP
jgi:hypothetical protein